MSSVADLERWCGHYGCKAVLGAILLVHLVCLFVVGRGVVSARQCGGSLVGMASGHSGARACGSGVQSVCFLSLFSSSLFRIPLIYSGSFCVFGGILVFCDLLTKFVMQRSRLPSLLAVIFQLSRYSSSFVTKCSDSATRLLLMFSAQMIL